MNLGSEGVKKSEIFADVINESPLMQISCVAMPRNVFSPPTSLSPKLPK